MDKGEWWFSDALLTVSCSWDTSRRGLLQKEETHCGINYLNYYACENSAGSSQNELLLSKKINSAGTSTNISVSEFGWYIARCCSQSRPKHIKCTQVIRTRIKSKRSYKSCRFCHFFFCSMSWHLPFKLRHMIIYTLIYVIHDRLIYCMPWVQYICATNCAKPIELLLPSQKEYKSLFSRSRAIPNLSKYIQKTIDILYA